MASIYVALHQGMLWCVLCSFLCLGPLSSYLNLLLLMKYPHPLEVISTWLLQWIVKMPLPNLSLYQPMIHLRSSQLSLCLSSETFVTFIFSCSMSSPLKTLRRRLGSVLLAAKILIFYIAGHTIQGLTDGC